MANEKKKCSFQPGISSDYMLRFCGQRKNLRGVKRRVGDMWQLPRGYVCYTPTGWVQMEVPKLIKRNIKNCKI